MIAAISPAAFNWEETTSTLRFADRVASIQTSTKANVEEEANQKAALQAEIDALKRELAGLDSAGGKKKGKKKELMAELQANELAMKNNQESTEDDEKKRADLEAKRKAALADAGLDSGELSEAFGVDKDTPHLLNISDDPTMAGMLIFYLKDGNVTLGKEPGDGGIKIKGLAVKDQHCVFNNSGNDKVTIKPMDDARLLVNG